MPALADWMTLDADWVAAHLPRHVEDVEDRAADLERIARPAGIRRGIVADCPHCDGVLVAWIDDERQLRGRIVCTRDAGHSWEREQWRHLGRVLDPTPDLLDATHLADWLSRRFLTRVERVTVWQWARRGYLDRIDGDHVGRPLYDRHAAADWYLEHRARRAG
ncbi:hypothetical protein [Kineococcus terrestris]|uniref:hypothetical protein n=1 Tax=Kineococcus terrestris TaxID=2044856 RepID=UPI0034DADBE8